MKTRSSIRAVIVEDEPLARETIEDFLKGEDWLELSGEAADGISAVRLIDDLRPDLVFLDVKMPGISGLQVLEAIQHDPEVVFTTAHDTHAITAFELGAIDYILKPFGRERFSKMLARVKERLLNGDEQSKSSFRDRALQALNTKPAGPLLRLFVRDRRGRLVQVPVADITRLVGADDYVEMHVGTASYLVNVTLAEFGRRLDPAHFCRVHRSVIVNLDKIVTCQRKDRRLHIELSDGSHVIASRSGSQDLRKLFV